MTAGRGSWPPTHQTQILPDEIGCCSPVLLFLFHPFTTLHRRIFFLDPLLDTENTDRKKGISLLQSAPDGPYETPLRSFCQHTFLGRKAKKKPSFAGRSPLFLYLFSFSLHCLSIFSLFILSYSSCSLPSCKCKSYPPYL